jgi:hypothetical protein
VKCSYLYCNAANRHNFDVILMSGSEATVSLCCFHYKIERLTAEKLSGYTHLCVENDDDPSSCWFHAGQIVPTRQSLAGWQPPVRRAAEWIEIG